MVTPIHAHTRTHARTHARVPASCFLCLHLQNQIEEYIDSWSTGGVDFGPSTNDDDEFGVDEHRPIMDSFA